MKTCKVQIQSTTAISVVQWYTVTENEQEKILTLTISINIQLYQSIHKRSLSISSWKSRLFFLQNRFFSQFLQVILDLLTSDICKTFLLQEIVLQEVPRWKGEDGTQLVGGWDHVTHVDFSHNFIKEIDDSVVGCVTVSGVGMSFY